MTEENTGMEVEAQEEVQEEVADEGVEIEDPTVEDVNDPIGEVEFDLEDPTSEFEDINLDEPVKPEPKGTTAEEIAEAIRRAKAQEEAEKESKKAQKDVLTKADLAELTEQIRRSVIEEIKQESSRHQEQQSIVQESYKRAETYMDKIDATLEKYGINDESNFLYDAIESKFTELLSLERSRLGTQVLTPAQVNKVAKQHWEIIKPKIKQAIPKKEKARPEQLGAAAKGQSTNEKPIALDKKVLQEYNTKRASGNITQMDAIKMLNAGRG